MSQNATCEACGQEMAPGGKCDFTHEQMGDGVVRQRIVFGQETRYADLGLPDLPQATSCHDCNVALGQPHHSGCDWEECPECRLQALGCGCYLTPEELRDES